MQLSCSSCSWAPLHSSVPDLPQGQQSAASSAPWLVQDGLFPNDPNVIAHIDGSMQDGLLGSLQVIIDPSVHEHWRTVRPGADHSNALAPGQNA